MKHSDLHTRKRPFLDETETGRNNLPPPFVPNRDADKFMWTWQPNLPLVQRIGVCLFGLTFLGLGIGLIGGARTNDQWAYAVYALLPLFLGVRLCWNGFRTGPRRTKQK
jgi:hypothetical protein